MTSRAAGGALGRRIASELGELTVHKVREVGFRNAEENSARIAGAQSILALRETPLMEGDTAIIVAAGPSLHRTDAGRQIREAGFRGTLIATDSAMVYCLRAGLVPDLIVTLDPHPRRILRWFGDPDLTREDLLQDDYFARQEMEPTFADNQIEKNREVLALVDRYGRSIRAATSSSVAPNVAKRIRDSGMIEYWWNPFYDDYDLPGSLTKQIHAMNGLPCLNAGGNVGSAAWVLAHALLDKKKIGIVGMDLSYYADTPYERTQYYHELVHLVGRERLGEVFIPIRNPHLEADFYTDPAYLWYRDSFLEMAQQADCETYNCTEGGILFGTGVQFAPLRYFLENPAANACEKGRHG